MTPAAILHRVLSNPYLYSATILARIAVLFATAFWSGMVMLYPDRLNPGRYPMYAEMLAIMPARLWAAGGLVICTIALARIWFHCRPHWTGPILYANLMGFWVYLSASLFMGSLHIPPAAAACITTVALLSIFAFVANPKTGDVSTV